MAPGHHLTPAQQRVLTLSSAGSTATAAAQFVDVHRINRRQLDAYHPFPRGPH
jgi:hypothetical protein